MIISVPKATVLLFKFNTNPLFMLMLKMAFSDLMLRFRTRCSINRTHMHADKFFEERKIWLSLERERLLVFLLKFSLFYFELVLFAANYSEKL